MATLFARKNKGILHRYFGMRIALVTISVGLCFTGGMCQGTASPAAADNPCQELPDFKDDFAQIDDVKTDVQRAVTEADEGRKHLTADMAKFQSGQNRIDDLNSELEALKGKRDPSSLNRSEQIKSDIQSIKTDVMEGKTLSEHQEQLKKFDDDYSWNKAKLQCINSTLSQLLSPEQKFKSWITIIFALLIGFVILGFFVMAFRFGEVRVATFSGQSGLQFLTLFSIVISIILFGVTKILQDKELAALLGGLSGYILGRYGATTTSPAQPSADKSGNSTTASGAAVSQPSVPGGST